MHGSAEPGDIDLYLIGEGTHRRLWEVLGAHLLPEGGCEFAVWAPNATGVRVAGDWNYWSGDDSRLSSVGSSGVWVGRVAQAREGQRYKFVLDLRDGRTVERSDPMARQAECPPATASVICGPSTHAWSQADGWREARARRNDGRLSIYEVHAHSWRWDEEGRPLGYRRLGAELGDHAAAHGFTHVELMPVATHPFGGSWGYQVTGYYAPDARGGSPDDLRAMVDELHQRGIGVILDWVPAHFPRDAGALARFDGTALYEHADSRRGEHPDWGTLVFNHGRHEVRNFLVANALYWLEEFRVDGLRVDAVASMLYLDYSREPGEWVPNRFGGREDLDAVEFIQQLNTIVGAEHPGALMVAEESTAWGGVTGFVHQGGLGFTHKWNLGWMHDTLGYVQHDPIHRPYHHGEMTFPMVYAFDEHWILPLSHDEVVHGKGSLLAKQPGDRWQRFANLRALLAWQWSMPGGQLLFMGSELAVPGEFADDRPLDWGLMGDPAHAGISDLVTDLNGVQSELPALWRGDHERGSAYWLDADDAAQSVFPLGRFDPETGQTAMVVANFTPVPRHGYRLGVPHAGRWSEVLNTDDPRYGGSGIFNGDLDADPTTPWQGQPASLLLTLPPLAVVWLAPALP